MDALNLKTGEITLDPPVTDEELERMQTVFLERVQATIDQGVEFLKSESARVAAREVECANWDSALKQYGEEVQRSAIDVQEQIKQGVMIELSLQHIAAEKLELARPKWKRLLRKWLS